MPKRRKYPPKPDRFQKAHQLANMGAVKSLREDKNGRILNALVPGSAAKTYEVIARREGRNYIETECLLQTGAGHQNCKGGYSAVCYHALAVLLTSARQRDLDCAICQTEQNANRRKNLGGQVYRVQSKYAPNNPLWIVANPLHPPDQPDAPDPNAPTKADQIKKELGY